MKLRKDMTYVKFGDVGKWCKVSELEIDGVPLQELYDRQANVEHMFRELLEELNDHYIVKSDTTYIIELDGKLKRIKDLKLYEDKNTKLPLKFYKVEDGKLIKDNKKVGAF